MKTRIPRRTFLRGLGGISVAAPFLSSVWERQAKGQTVAKPKQFIAMFTHYGCITTSSSPRSRTAPSRPATSWRRTSPPSRRTPQDPHSARHPRDERVDSKQPERRGRGQSNDPHLNVAASYFTLQPVTPVGNDPFSFDTAYQVQRLADRQLAGPGHGATDQPERNAAVHARRQPNGRRRSPSISYLKDATAAADAPAKGYPGLGTPSQVFSAIMGLFDKGSTGGMTAATLRDAARPEGLRPRQGRPRVPRAAWSAAPTT